ncbi:hypothetical protein B0H14DRAFT_3731381 [Mycena olivaceomarginata]|nr:hypothetical protein B0H14DRAFT_3731381 [Mycena olivaceomarginata]
MEHRNSKNPLFRYWTILGDARQCQTVQKWDSIDTFYRQISSGIASYRIHDTARYLLPCSAPAPPARLPAATPLLVHRHCARTRTRTRTRRPHFVLRALPASPLLLTPLLSAVHASMSCACTRARTGTGTPAGLCSMHTPAPPPAPVPAPTPAHTAARSCSPRSFVPTASSIHPPAPMEGVSDGGVDADEVKVDGAVGDAALRIDRINIDSVQIKMRRTLRNLWRLAVKNRKPYKLATADKIGKTYDVKTDPETARRRGNNSREGTKDAEDVVVEREVSTQYVTAVMSFSARTNSAKSGLTYDFKSTS